MEQVPKKKMGRPLKVINEQLLYDLASIFCTYDEMAHILKVNKDTLSDRYSDLIKQAQSNGKMSLRRWQYQAARKGNSALLIWLGKQHLGQKEVVVNQNYDGNKSEKELREEIKEKAALVLEAVKTA